MGVVHGLGVSVLSATVEYLFASYYAPKSFDFSVTQFKGDFNFILFVYLYIMILFSSYTLTLYF